MSDVSAHAVTYPIDSLFNPRPALEALFQHVHRHLSDRYAGHGTAEHVFIFPRQVVNDAHRRLTCERLAYAASRRAVAFHIAAEITSKHARIHGVAPLLKMCQLHLLHDIISTVELSLGLLGIQGLANIGGMQPLVESRVAPSTKGCYEVERDVFMVPPPRRPHFSGTLVSELFHASAFGVELAETSGWNGNGGVNYFRLLGTIPSDCHSKSAFNPTLTPTMPLPLHSTYAMMNNPPTNSLRNAPPPYPQSNDIQQVDS
ncbi:uncharacterized protein MYCFIDRAFT_206285 [Pseudocercospora fijiensis CIRAD86]|uniref:Uncharacterized protein n=1 Tax=Pseudocercospora fijiensis (strain CIRAD86) TaxID=383855 RepID=N1QCR6_PSEFD|nr:uncharacterized protein MYCFIDRAFT_206285 [Pseudocercospora fijiensis CIRAD86]EME89268.1 hypothetical protein MYCFIDRAFT_206285 [Pseudocercospora fijiensis CIRAD86]